MLQRLVSTLSGQSREERRAREYRELIRREATIGGTLFGEVAKGCRREFFCLNQHTWIWHEEWVDANGKRQTVTTRYDIRHDGILKAQDGQPYQRVTAEEARRLSKAVVLYGDRVRGELYANVQ